MHTIVQNKMMRVTNHTEREQIFTFVFGWSGLQPTHVNEYFSLQTQIILRIRRD
jgi:hypothetical protein